jgi:pimeloyl-ACP methyl ester carboxylesterase
MVIKSGNTGRRGTILFVAGLLVMLLFGCGNEVEGGAINLPPYTIYHTFDEYLEQVRYENSKYDIREGCEDRLVRNVSGRAAVSILYIHGFGASRAEGEAVCDQVARKLGANIFYLRLPGHGTSMDDMRKHTFREHLAAARDAVLMMDQLGERIFIVGNSYGGLLATYLSALFPHRISGTILVSPFYGCSDMKAEFVLRNSYALDLLKKYMPMRTVTMAGVIDESWRNYWYDRQYTESLEQLVQARKRILIPSVLDNVDVPVCMIYYYRDRENQDHTASAVKMRRVFKHFTNPANREVQIPRGNHVLTSRFFSADTVMVEEEMTKFIDMVLMEVPAPKPNGRGFLTEN